MPLVLGEAQTQHHMCLLSVFSFLHFDASDFDPRRNMNMWIREPLQTKNTEMWQIKGKPEWMLTDWFVARGLDQEQDKRKNAK